MQAMAIKLMRNTKIKQLNDIDLDAIALTAIAGDNAKKSIC